MIFFRPKSYMQLLSDDGTNRTLLTWLKLWDKIVYGKEVPKKPSKAGPDGEPQKFQFHSNNEVIDEYDSTGRPQQKTVSSHCNLSNFPFLLLCANYLLNKCLGTFTWTSWTRKNHSCSRRCQPCWIQRC